MNENSAYTTNKNNSNRISFNSTGELRFFDSWKLLTLARSREISVSISQFNNTKSYMKVSSSGYKNKVESNKEPKKPPELVRGIKRIEYSSNCYINAAVQVLFNMDELSNFIQKNKFTLSNSLYYYLNYKNFILIAECEKFFFWINNYQIKVS